MKLSSILLGSSAKFPTIPFFEPNEFRSMSYNIYIGGDQVDDGTAFQKHIARVNPDVLSIQEAGNASVLQSRLENLGFTDFYGPGGNFGQYFASKHPIVYNTTMTNVDWSRNPLYTEVDINGYLIGVASIHLDSNCSGFCREADFENNEPFEPSAQRRCVQLYQIMSFLNDRKIANSDLDAIIIQGDYNLAHNELNVLEYTEALGDETLPSGMSYPIDNRQVPFKQFESFSGSLSLDTTNAHNGDFYTWWPPPLNPNPIQNNFPVRIDYIAYDGGLTLIEGEILNSISDSSFPEKGIRKYGSSLAENDGYIASDHLPVVADFRIENE